MKERRDIEFFRSDLEHLAANAAFRALMQDLEERDDFDLKWFKENMLSSPRKIADGNRRIGMMEERDYVRTFFVLALAEINEREEKLKEGKEDDVGK